MELFVKAARDRGDVLDHILLSGPPGLGKTTLAYILADGMEGNIKSTSGPVIDKPADLAGLLTNLERGDMLFIDEIHRMQKAVEEYLYSAMEDFVIDIVIDQGAVRALMSHNRSLLPPGVVETLGEFRRGDIVSIVGPDRGQIACGITNYDSDEIDRIRQMQSAEINDTLGHHYGDEVVHRDNMVILS